MKKNVPLELKLNLESIRYTQSTKISKIWQQLKYTVKQTFFVDSSAKGFIVIVLLWIIFPI